MEDLSLKEVSLVSTVTLVDMSGKQMIKKTFTGDGSLPAEGLSPGVYQAVARNNSRVIREVFVISR